MRPLILNEPLSAAAYSYEDNIDSHGIIELSVRTDYVVDGQLGVDESQVSVDKPEAIVGECGLGILSDGRHFRLKIASRLPPGLLKILR